VTSTKHCLAIFHCDLCLSTLPCCCLEAAQSLAMVNTSHNGGTSLAPTPTHPHQLSREPSREDVEMAKQLSQLNQAQDSHMPRTTSPSQSHRPSQDSPAQTPEIYHSLEDSLPMRESEQPEQPSVPATPTSFISSGAPSGNVLITGQVCRYAASLLPLAFLTSS